MTAPLTGTAPASPPPAKTTYKSLDEHREYLQQIVRLKLFFLHRWLEEHPHEEFSPALRSRVDIYRKTDVNRGHLNPSGFDWNDPSWLAIEAGLQRIYQGCLEDRTGFEEAGIAYLQPTLEARLWRDYLDRSALYGYQCGSLRHNLYEEKQVEAVVFHIANAVCPRSIFDDPLYLPDCFLALMRRVERLYGATRITTGTWLNSYYKWLSLFPAEWEQNMSEPRTDVQWHYGFWGQFINARGTFNAKAGEQLRQTGEFPFQLRSSSCSIAAMRQHLRQYFYERE